MRAGKAGETEKTLSKIHKEDQDAKTLLMCIPHSLPRVAWSFPPGTVL